MAICQRPADRSRWPLLTRPERASNRGPDSFGFFLVFFPLRPRAWSEQRAAARDDAGVRDGAPLLSCRAASAGRPPGAVVLRANPWALNQGVAGPSILRD